MGKFHSIREVRDVKTLVSDDAKLYADMPAFAVKEQKGGIYKEISHEQLKKDVDALGTKLLDLGLKDAKIAIIGANSYQWVVAYLATITGTGVAVPLDKELKKEEVHNLVKTAECSVVFYGEEYSDYFDDLNIEHKFRIDAYQNKDNMEKDNHIYGLIKDGYRLLEKGNKEFIETTIDDEKMALILFTSGTTGVPKGVMLSHKNICHVVKGTSKIFKINKGERSLSVLPIHHTFESIIGILVVLYQGGNIAFCEGLKYVLKNMQEAQASIIVGVPLIVESIYSKIWKEAEKTGKDKLLKKAIKMNKFLMALGIDKREKIFSSIRKKFGGNFKYVISGAASINPNVLRGFIDLGFGVTQGYGLTETAPLVAGVPDFENIYKKAGSCGPAIPGTEIKIADKDNEGIGEILVKGDNVMLGYYNMPEETAEVLKDGWFHTGDLGFLDKEGWLYITGRKKNVIVTKTGKNIYPEEIEVLVNDNKYIEDSMIYGPKEEDGEEYYVAIQIKPDYEALKEDKGDLSDEDIYKIFKSWIDEINDKLAVYKRIKKVQIRKEDFIRTTTKKIKRNANI